MSHLRCQHIICDILMEGLSLYIVEDCDNYYLCRKMISNDEERD